MEKDVAVIGDIHGCLESLKRLKDKINKNVRIILCGDVIDRGPKSKETLEFIIENEIEMVLGNHEEFMLNTLVENNTIYAHQSWLSNGGYQTLESYGEDIETFQKHQEFLKTLPLFIHIEVDGHKDLVVSHSLIQHVWKGKDYDYIGAIKDDILWSHISRDGGVFFNRDANKEFDTDIFNIIGHTPLQYGPLITNSVAAIDTGCCFKVESYGKLTAICYPSLETIIQENID